MKSTQIFTALFILMSQSLFAQQSKWELGLGAGFAPYLGDINKSFIYTPAQMGMGAKVHLKRNFSPSLGVRLSANYLSLKGDDKNFDSPEWRNKRGFAFTNNVIEASLAFEYDLMGKKRAKNEQWNKKWSPYLLGGIGMAFHDPKPTFNEPNIIANASLISEDKVSVGQMTTVVIPIGLGLRYRINNNWALAAEFTSSIGTSDYIDGISQAGNPNKNDWYALSSLSIIKKFGTIQAKENKNNNSKQKSSSNY